MMTIHSCGRPDGENGVPSRPESLLPQNSLLDEGELPLEDLAMLIIRESHRPNPIYGVHRWFARRSASEFRALLSAATLDSTRTDDFWPTFDQDLSLDGITLLDPFAGGGTSLVEAAKVGAQVIGYEIDPVAAFITKFELDSPIFEAAPAELRVIVDACREAIAPYHETTGKDGETATAIHHFWVEVLPCPHCGDAVDLHPHYRLAYNRDTNHQWVICAGCGDVHDLPLDDTILACHCGGTTELSCGPYGGRHACRCPRCHASFDLLEARGSDPQPPVYRLIAQEYIDEGRGVRAFRAATNEDRERYRVASERLASLAERGEWAIPDRAIPPAGRSDQRPLIHGIRRYRDLFNDRQLLHLTLLCQQIQAVTDLSLRRILSLAFSEHLTTNCMYTAYAFGYRRLSPLFSIHSYRHITRPVEINPWLDGIGRGTFPNSLRKVNRGIAAADRQWGSRRPAGYVSSSPIEVLKGASRAAVAPRSAEHIADLSAGSIDLVMTDPPYFDNISYSEYSDFYLAWHQMLGCAEPPYDSPEATTPMASNLAVASGKREAVETYAKTLALIFSECRRVLKENGRFVFTYHHRSPAAWHAVGAALHKAGLITHHVFPMRGEGNGGLHSFTGTIKWDAVFVCRPGVTQRQSEILLPQAAIDAARRCAKTYEDRLKRDPRLGFRMPDYLNLYRACLCGEATRYRSNGSDDGIPLGAALKDTGVT